MDKGDVNPPPLDETGSVEDDGTPISRSRQLESSVVL